MDLLLDASASRLHCQEVIAAQGSILAESLANCGIPVRVSAFSSLRGYTVLRVLKDFADKNRQNINRYFASGWNRDGLALLAAGDLLDFAPGPAPRHLLILLTDASPNDSRRIPPSPENPLGCGYEDAAGVADAAVQVRVLQRKGIRVSAVFMGEDRSAADAARIYCLPLLGEGFFVVRHTTASGILQPTVALYFGAVPGCSQKSGCFCKLLVVFCRSLCYTMFRRTTGTRDVPRSARRRPALEVL